MEYMTKTTRDLHLTALYDKCSGWAFSSIDTESKNRTTFSNWLTGLWPYNTNPPSYFHAMGFFKWTFWLIWICFVISRLTLLFKPKSNHLPNAFEYQVAKSIWTLQFLLSKITWKNAFVKEIWQIKNTV